MRRRISFLAVAVGLLVGLSVQAASPNLGTEQERERGRELYDKYCSQCHGLTGDGKGYAATRVKPEPRDFTNGKYKFRTTPSGAMPTDDDLRRVIVEGLPYTSMPGWPMFSATDVQDIIYHIKSFSEDFSNADMLVDPIDIPEPPPITDESIEKGREFYTQQGCAACHGEVGRSDGLSAKTLKDDWGFRLRSADLTARWTFRGGPTRKDIFRTFSTGLNGTPMPSYGDTLGVEDRWHLVNYIASLGDGEAPNYKELLIADCVEDELDFENEDALFENARMARFPLIGQIIQPGRSFYPAATQVMVQAVYNQKEIVFRVRWNDMSAETTGTNSPLFQALPWDDAAAAAEGHGAGGGEEEEEGGFWGEEAAEDEGDIWGDEEEEDEGDFWGEEGEDDAAGAGVGISDAVALQFPSQLPTGNRKPYFLLGDVQNSVDIWFVEMARQIPQLFKARGSDSIEPSQDDEIEVATRFDRGEWTVLFKRSLRSNGGIEFSEEQFTPIAFSVWDGFTEEQGNKRALSAWFYVYTEPEQVVSAIGPMVRAALGLLLIEIIVIVWVRRKFKQGVPAGGDDRMVQGHQASV